MPDFKKLTTGEVASKRFTPVRMREGYSTDEVDEFLESVEATIEAYDADVERITAAYNELKSRPAPTAPVQESGALSSAQAEIARLRKRLSDEEGKTASLQNNLSTMGNQLIEARAAAEAAKADAASAKIIDPADLDMASATGIIARMLENAAKNHDDLIAQGEAEAMRIRDEAEEEIASRLAEAESAKTEAYSNLETRQKALEKSVADLESIEKSAREELVKTYTDALAELKSSGFVTK